MIFFKVLTGFISPRSIGLIGQEETLEILKKAKLMFKAINYNFNAYSFVINFCISFIPLAINGTYTQVFIYAIPWSIHYSYATLFSSIAYAWQLVYFYLICYYLKIKLKTINDKLKLLSNDRY